MSIRKNNNSSRDLHVTCERLSKLPISSTVGATEYNITQYVHCQNAGFRTMQSGMYQGTCLMRAIIPTTAEGYILGCRYTNSTDYDMYCRIEEVNGVKSVVWHYLGTTIGSRPLDPQEQPHDYGFVNGYAVYDHEKVDPNQVLATPPRKTTREFGFGCCSYYYGSGDSYNYCSDIYIIRCDCDLYESFTPAAYEMAWLCRYYPIYRGFYNAMRLIKYSLDDTTGEGGSITEGPDLVEAYGIQKDDLVYITNGKYRDVLALMTDDGGVDARSGQVAGDIEPPYTEIVGHSMAFDMRNTAYPGGVTPDPSTSLPDRRGRLLRGRKPKWDIWQDSVAHGFYIMDDNGVKTLMFNIFKLANGLNTDVHLEWFDGYNTDPATSHPPKITATADEINVPFHNGMNYECTLDNLALGHIDSQGALSGADDQQLFFVRNVADFTFNVVAGNAIPWNIPKAELLANPNCYYFIMGIGTQLIIDSDVMASSVEQESKYMCADNHTAEELALLKTKYRETGVGGTLVLNYLSTILRNKLIAAGATSLNGLISVALKTAGGDITMPELLGNKSVPVNGTFNGKLYSGATSNGRKFVSENLASGKYLAYNELIRAPYAAITGDPKILLLQAHECNAEGTELVDTADDYFALVTLEKATQASPNICSSLITTLVPGRKFAVDSATNPYNVGTVEHAIYQHTYNNIYDFSFWYKGTYNLSDAWKDSKTIHFAMSTDDLLPNGSTISFSESDLNYGNLRYDIYNAARRPRLTRFDGEEYVDAADTINMNGDSCFLTLRTPRQMLHTGNAANNLIVGNMLMQRYTKSGNTYTFINDGPDSGQTTPLFKQFVSVKRNGVLVAKFQFYFSDEPSYYDFVYNASTRTYSHPEGYDTIGGDNSNYQCNVDFVEMAEDFIDPNGHAKTKLSAGPQWFYVLNITYTGSSSNADYPQAGDVYDITFSDN